MHEGVVVEKGLDVRDISREQLLSRPDILNIQRQLNLGSITKHSNDDVGTCAWVQEMKALSYNPVIMFKTSGKSASKCGVYGANNTQKLICIRHVDRAWRKSLITGVEEPVRL